MELHLQFKKFRKQSGISQVKLSKWSGVSRATIWRFEIGRPIMTDSFDKIVKAMNAKVIIINKEV